MSLYLKGEGGNHLRCTNGDPKRPSQQATPHHIARSCTHSYTMVCTYTGAGIVPQQDGDGDHRARIDRIHSRHDRRRARSMPHARPKKRAERPPSRHGREDQHCEQLRVVQVAPVVAPPYRPPQVLVDKDTKEIKRAEQQHCADGH